MPSTGELIMYLVQALTGIVLYSVRSDIAHVKEVVEIRVKNIEDRVDRIEK